MSIIVRFFMWICGIKATKVEKIVIDLEANVESYESFGKSQNR